MGNIFSRCTGASRVDELNAPQQGNTASAALTKPQQPVTAPSAWFLTQDELTKSRGGELRSDLSVFSTGANVTMFASTDHYFKSLLDEMDASDVASIWISGWSLNHTVPLDPASKAPDDTTLRAVIERAVRHRGVHARALVWANLFQRKVVIATRDWMNSIDSRGSKGSALMLFDNRLPHHVSSHHQKCVVIQKLNGAFVSFMGGVDITVDRWDTIAHDQKAIRERTGWRGNFDGWVDAGVRMDGTAARDVATTFAARWNSSIKPANCWKEELLDFQNPDTYAQVPTPPLPTSATPVTKGSSLSVQIARTFSPHRATRKYPEIAPRGELSILQSRIKAIALAKNCIFIEDQYFFFIPLLMGALWTAMKANTSLQVVVVVQRPGVSTESKYGGYEKLIFEMAHPLLDAFASRFHVFTTKKSRNLYVHTKVMIVDDVFLSVSSANWNRRSMTSDTELASCIVDAEGIESADGVLVGKRVLQFRLTKFQELTGRSTEALQTLTLAQSIDLLKQAASEDHTILERLEVDDKWEFLVFNEEFTLRVVDPDDVNHAEHGDDSSDEE